MKCKALIVVLLISMFVAQDVHSWGRFRFRIRVRRALQRICHYACPRVCSHVLENGVLRYICKVKCSNICNGKKKRQVSGNDHVTPLPTDFHYYDLDEDSCVTVEELAATLGQDQMYQEIEEDDLIKCFNQTDTDNNGCLTETELFSSDCLVFADTADTAGMPDTPGTGFGFQATGG